MSDTLEPYRRKRDFSRTPEPKGGRPRGGKKAAGPRRYLIQRHAATRLHYDLRLEHDGVLKSWAVTKAPSRDPAVKRLAVEVEDHPLEYGRFEGVIPPGGYGAGTVQMWDVGAWTPRDDDVDAALAQGMLKLTLEGDRLKGGWVLVRLTSDRGKPARRPNWLLVKERDEHAVAGEGDALAAIDASVITGRSLEQIAGGAPGPAAGRARASTTPAFLPLQLAKTAPHPPAGAGWAHEIKFDGYRIQVAVQAGQVRLWTRSGLDWTARFPALARQASRWPDAVLDGELCALDADHTPDFSALQTAISDQRTDDIVYFAFDLLRQDGDDLRRRPLSERKARLQAYCAAVGGAGPALRYVEHFTSSGRAVLNSACRMDLEGVISKSLNAPYRAGRSATWLKSKCRGRDEVVIGGWSSADGSRLRSLLVGVNGAGGLAYRGRVGTGFSSALSRILLPALRSAATDRNPFAGANVPRGGRDIHWVRPVLVAEIEHAGSTEGGLLRHAAYKGLREDKPAAEVTAPPQAPAAAVEKPGRTVVAGVTLSNPDKPLWPAQGDRPALTKADLARYYEAAADRLLPHVRDRPLSIVRAPDGVEGERFFQRHARPGQSPRLKLIAVGARKPYVAVADAGGLVAIGQAGGLELHPWGCRPGDPETPDQITFDLDPDEGLAFVEVITAARRVRDVLQGLGLPAFAKTTGGKGLHVVTPIRSDGRSRVTWDQAKAFARAVSEAVAAEAPDRFTTTLSKKARGGRIFLDYLRNGRMATAVAPWSPRARPGGTIACPLAWTQVRKGLNPQAFNLFTAGALLKAPDPWADFRSAETSLRPALKALRVKA